MITFLTDYTYLESRYYVHGTSILIDALKKIEDHLKLPVYLKRIKFQREVINNGRILLLKSPNLLNKIDDAHWHLICGAGNDIWHAAFFEEDIPVSHRTEVNYRLKDVECDKEFGGICHLCTSNRSETIYALVEANKRFHQGFLSTPGTNPKIRLGYIEDWHVPLETEGWDTVIMAKTLISRRVGSGLMTVNRIFYTNKEGTNTSLTMCFDVKFK